MDKARLLAELNGFLSIPSISTLPAHAADCRRAATWLVEAFRDLGCPVVELLEGQGNPLVWAESPKVEGKPTVLCYGHYDVQPGDPLDQWTSPPFGPPGRGGKPLPRGGGGDQGEGLPDPKAY